MLSTLIWQSVNFVVGGMSQGDLRNSYKIDVSRRRVFGKFSLLHISILIAYAYKNKIRKDRQTNRKSTYSWHEELCHRDSKKKRMASAKEAPRFTLSELSKHVISSKVALFLFEANLFNHIWM